MLRFSLCVLFKYPAIVTLKRKWKHYMKIYFTYISITMEASLFGFKVNKVTLFTKVNKVKKSYTISLININKKIRILHQGGTVNSCFN